MYKHRLHDNGGNPNYLSPIMVDTAGASCCSIQRSYNAASTIRTDTLIVLLMQPHIGLKARSSAASFSSIEASRIQTYVDPQNWHD